MRGVVVITVLAELSQILEARYHHGGVGMMVSIILRCGEFAMYMAMVLRVIPVDLRAGIHELHVRVPVGRQPGFAELAEPVLAPPDVAPPGAGADQGVVAVRVGPQAHLAHLVEQLRSLAHSAAFSVRVHEGGKGVDCLRTTRPDEAVVPEGCAGRIASLGVAVHESAVRDLVGRQAGRRHGVEPARCLARVA